MHGKSVDREAGEDVEVGWAGRRVVEAVTDGHDPVDVAGAPRVFIGLLLPGG
jgi:hypothetical protein